MKERVAALRAEPEPEDLGLSVAVDPEESAGRAFSPVEVGRTLQFTSRLRYNSPLIVLCCDQEQLEVKFRSLAENMDAMYSTARSPLRIKQAPGKSPKESSGRKKLRAARRVRSPEVSLPFKP